MDFLGQVTSMPMPQGEPGGWIIWMFATALGTLASAVGFLWKRLDATHTEVLERQEKIADKNEQRWVKCEEEHAKTNEKVIELTGVVGSVKGQYELLTKLHAETLKAVHRGDSSSDIDGT